MTSRGEVMDPRLQGHPHAVQHLAIGSQRTHEPKLSRRGRTAGGTVQPRRDLSAANLLLSVEVRAAAR